MGDRLKAEGRSYWSFRTPCSAGETPEFEASCSSPARGLKLRPVPPSLRPSPLGRGGMVASRRARLRSQKHSSAVRVDSLSLRERAGVRGKELLAVRTPFGSLPRSDTCLKG